jgi:hypothetical protein
MLDAADGVRESLRLQEERSAEIVAAASLDPNEFAQQQVTNDQVNHELAQLFPPARKGQLHAIFEGAPYQPDIGDNEESPPIAALLGVQLEASDYRMQRSKLFVLSSSAIDKVRAAVQQRLGAASQNALRTVVSRGLPHVVVDSGSISVSLALTLESPPTRHMSPRVVARTIDDRSPHNQQLRVDILSRLEVRFKTTS